MPQAGTDPFTDNTISKETIGKVNYAIVLFGTGISKALSSNDASDWKGQIRRLAEGRDEKDSIEKMLKSGQPYHYTAMLHVLRRALGKEGWKERFNSCVSAVVEEKRGGAIADEWHQLLREMGKASKERQLGLATTNFDDLVALASGLKVISRTGVVYDPKLNTSDAPDPVHILPSAPLPGREGGAQDMTESKRMVLRLWSNHENLAGSLRSEIWERAAGVLHIHGWYRLQEELVIDPVDYHLARDRAIGSDLTATLLVNALLNPSVLVVFAGLGDSVFDDHFTEIFHQCADLKKRKEKGFNAETNLWLLNPHANREHPQNLDDSIRGYLTDLGKKADGFDMKSPLTPVFYESNNDTDYSQAPSKLREILTRFKRLPLPGRSPTT